jgi:hypothetical protein
VKPSDVVGASASNAIAKTHGDVIRISASLSPCPFSYTLAQGVPDFCRGLLFV